MLFHTAVCCYAECHILFTIMLSLIVLSVVMMSVVMLSVVMLSVVMLSVQRPFTQFQYQCRHQKQCHKYQTMMQATDCDKQWCNNTRLTTSILVYNYKQGSCQPDCTPMRPYPLIIGQELSYKHTPSLLRFYYHFKKFYRTNPRTENISNTFFMFWLKNFYAATSNYFCSFLFCNNDFSTLYFSLCFIP